MFLDNKILFVQNAARFTFKDSNKYKSPSSEVLYITDVFYKITIEQIVCSFERLYTSLEGKVFYRLYLRLKRAGETGFCEKPFTLSSLINVKVRSCSSVMNGVS